MALTWDDIANQYGAGLVSEGQAQHQTPDQVAQQQDQGALVQALMAANPSTRGPSVWQGGSSVSQGAVNPGMSLEAATAAAQRIMGGGGQQQQQQPSDPNAVNQQNYLNNLGTYAMRMSMGGTNQIPVVGNPQPQSGNLSIGGIAQVPGATYTSPSNQALQSSLFGPDPWSQVGQSAGLSSKDIAAFQKQGLTPTQVAGKFNVAAPTTSTPSPGVFAAAPTPSPTQTTPLQPRMPGTASTNISTGVTPIQISGAVPPPAPSMPQIQAPATPAPYTGTVENDPFMSHAVTNLLGWTTNPWHPANSPGSPPQTMARAPQKMASGGRIQGSTDTQPALLTPGEYVIKKDAVDRYGVANLDRINRGQEPVRRMDDGGYVDKPREEPRQMAGSGTTTQPSQQQGGQAEAQGTLDSLANNLSRSAGMQHPDDLLTLARLRASQNFSTQEATAQAGGSAPGLGRAAQMAWNTGTNPNAGLPAGTSGYLGPSGNPVGATPGTTGVSPTAVGASAVGSITGAISDAVNKWASSIGSWKTQPSAIPQPGPAQAPNVQFSQQQAQQPQQGQRQMNPYLLGMYGNPGYPYT